MKKLLLLFTIAFCGMNAFAQGSCATAVTLTNGTFVAGTVNGTYPTTICWNTPSATPNALWYKFTPTEGGIMTVSSDIEVNPGGTAGTDTRLGIYTGTCAALTCVGGSDDVSASNYRTTVADFEVVAGTTYYIVWDDRWQDTSFSFTFDFLAATCFSPSGFGFITAPTTTDASIGWDAPTAGTAPAGYQVEYGLGGFTQGTGTILDVTIPEVDLVGLSSSTVYDFYVRTSCGGSDYSIWTGPLSFVTVFEPATVPYAMPFEQASFAFLGWSASVSAPATGSDWFLINIPTLAAEATQRSVVSLSNDTDTADANLFSRAVTLAAGNYTATYYVLNYLFVDPAAPAGTVLTGTANYQLTMGTTADVASQTTILNSEVGVSNTTFEQRTVNFNVPVAGTYFFRFLHNSDLNFESDLGTHGFILDQFTVSAALSVEDAISKKFSVYPNPSNNVINVSNNENINVNAIQITDLNGRIVKNVKFVNATEIQVNVADLATGMYMMNISSDQGTATKKIVRN